MPEETLREETLLSAPRLATSVVGAGPAGMLFCFIARLLSARRGVEPGRWALRLYDKREAYARSHRLRMDPRPYLEIQRELEDPRYDALIEFLSQQRFSPAVNLLEEQLGESLAGLGVRKELLCVGAKPGEVDLAALSRLQEVPPGVPLTVVASDSVHSTVRELVRGSVSPARYTHQQVARLRVVGPGLPEGLDVVDQYKLSKALGSILDYRLNSNGFGEVDLFLVPREHAAVAALGASPKEPVRLDSGKLGALSAPLFRRIVSQLERGFGGGPCEVLLQSTFRLEHTVMPVRYFAREEARVFLLGDAAVSLPFFRGMACLARCAHALAHVHCDLLEGGDAAVTPEVEAGIARWFLGPERPVRFGLRVLPGRITDVRPTIHRGARAFVVLHRWLGRYGVHVLAREAEERWRSLYRLAPVPRGVALTAFAARADPARRYDAEVEAIVRGELSVVRARGALVRGVREFVRLSSLLPFPVQSWFLSAPEGRPLRDHVTPGLCLNVGVAALAAGLALGGPAFSALGWAGAGWTAWAAWAALPAEALGGFVYRAARTFETGPHRFTSAVWQLQIALLFLLGISLSAWATWEAGRLSQVGAALSWLVLPALFVVGMYLFEWLGRRWLSAGDLDPG